MKKVLSIFLIISILCVSFSYAQNPSPSISSLYKTVPHIEITVYNDLTKTVYPTIMLYCKDILKMWLKNVYIHEAILLHLNNVSYQLVTFYFPTNYINCKVMAVFFGASIWIRTGFLNGDGGVIFDMTEITGEKVQMYLFSNI